MSEFDNIFGLAKAGGPFIGPKGGKWADAAHTIAWDDKRHADHGRPGPALVDGVDTLAFDTAEGRARHQLTLKPDGSNHDSWRRYHENANMDNDAQIAGAQKNLDQWRTQKWDSSMMIKKKTFLEARDRNIKSAEDYIEHVQAIKKMKADGTMPAGPTPVVRDALEAPGHPLSGKVRAIRMAEDGGDLDGAMRHARDLMFKVSDAEIPLAEAHMERIRSKQAEALPPHERARREAAASAREKRERDQDLVDSLNNVVGFGGWGDRARRAGLTKAGSPSFKEFGSIFGVTMAKGSEASDLPLTTAGEFALLFGVMMAKGKKAVMGEVRSWRGGQFKKTPDGWVPVKGGRRQGAGEEASSEGGGKKPPQSQPEKEREAKPKRVAREGSDGKFSDRTQKFYDVNPKAAPGQVAAGARVGIPGKMGLTKSVPRLPRLTPDERKIETQFASAFEKAPEEMANLFYENAKKEKYVFETDGAKALMPAWTRPDLPPDAKGAPLHPDRAKARALYNTTLHQTANAIAKRAFIKRLDEIKDLPDHQKKILVTCGGVAAGKGSALGARPDLAASVAATWDAAGEQNATENPWLLDECEKRGIKATFLFVHADAQKAWPGVVNRAKGIGRMVDARLFADSYGEGGRNVKAFYEQHKDHPNAEFVFAKFAAHDPVAVGRAIEAEKAKAGDNSERNAQLDKAAADLKASPDRAQMIAMGAKVNVPAEITPGMPEEALQVDSDNLYNWCNQHIDSVRESVPDYIYQGATAGRRIWKTKT